jgi:hypothetical protein
MHHKDELRSTGAGGSFVYHLMLLAAGDVPKVGIQMLERVRQLILGVGIKRST